MWLELAEDRSEGLVVPAVGIGAAGDGRAHGTLMEEDVTAVCGPKGPP